MKGSFDSKPPETTRAIDVINPIMSLSRALVIVSRQRADKPCITLPFYGRH